MADYPDALFDPRAKENMPGIIYDPAKKTVNFVEDENTIRDEILAIEGVLGLGPFVIAPPFLPYLEDLVGYKNNIFHGRADLTPAVGFGFPGQYVIPDTIPTQFPAAIPVGLGTGGHLVINRLGVLKTYELFVSFYCPSVGSPNIFILAWRDVTKFVFEGPPSYLLGDIIMAKPFLNYSLDFNP